MGLTTHDIVIVKDIKMFKKKSIIINTLEFDRREKFARIIRGGRNLFYCGSEYL